MNPSNVRRDIWTKLVWRAGVRPLDMYSLRHTFATLGRVAGESAFQRRPSDGSLASTLVDAVYAHSLQSGKECRGTRHLPTLSANSRNCVLSRADSGTLDSR
jgi:hypothetical protein